MCRSGIALIALAMRRYFETSLVFKKLAKWHNQKDWSSLSLTERLHHVHNCLLFNKHLQLAPQFPVPDALRAWQNVT